VGTLLLPYIPLATFKLGVGVVLVGYCTFMLIAAGRVKLAVGGRNAEAAVGLAAGVLGGLAALSGVLVTIWASLKDWPKVQRRVFFQAFNFTVLTAMLLASVASGQVGLRSVLALCIAAPGTFIGAWVGLRLYHRLNDLAFDRLILAVLLLSGVGLIWTSL
jgi:uncharacterized membrane protein YfcA